MSTSSTTFDWPTQYYFPPFFTIQPNTETRTKQLEIWSKLILNYCKTHRIFILEKSQNEIPLFNNSQISRQLSVHNVGIIFEWMRSKGQIEWIDDKSKERCFVFWKTSHEWSSLIYNWANQNGLLNTVETFYEILNSNSEFRGMDQPMLTYCLHELARNGKAELIGDEGVKFF